MSVRATILERLQAAFPDAQMDLRDMTGTNDHWELHIASEAFDGLSRVKKHQAIYKPLNDMIAANTVHALKISTYSHDEWAER
jgi:stress-induced morphogen